MDVTIVRHGIAVSVGTEGVTRDEDRMLSEQGRKRTEAAARGLRALRCHPDVIYTSPLVRAVETAEIMAGALKGSHSVEIADVLAPGHDLEAVHQWLAELRCDQAALVGHMPCLAELAASLVGAGADMNITFKKAGACRISFTDRARPGEGTLEWLIQPHALRALARAN